jgi:hypothetical protein
MPRFDSLGDHDRSRAPLFFFVFLALILLTALGTRFPAAAQVIAGALATYGVTRLALWQRNQGRTPPQASVRGPLSREEIQKARTKLSVRPTAK